MSIIFRCLAFIILSCAAIPAMAAPTLVRPIDCTPGTDCWIVNYADNDPAPGSVTDFSCGAASYDGHDGTDFAVKDRKAMEKGVPVRAAAAGTILRMRDGLPDTLMGRSDSGKECGNGLMIDHGEGWQTQYCHLKQGSIKVRSGQIVEAGTIIAAIGQSGQAEFPHLHLTLRHNNKPIDPFTGQLMDKGCTTTPQTGMWTSAMPDPLRNIALYASGFVPGTPDYAHIQGDTSSPARLPASSAALSFWSLQFNSRAGDKIHMDITGPDGKIFAERTIVQDKNRARQFYFVGRKTISSPLIPGTYTGRTHVTRALPNGTEAQATIETILEITP